MTPKKLIISNYDSPLNPFFSGGGATSIAEITGRLSRKYSIEIITSKYPGFINYQTNNVTYTHIGVASKYPKVSQIVFQLLLPFYALIKKSDIWIETFAPPFTATLLPLFARRPVIGLVHMLPALDLQRKYRFPIIPRLFEILILKLYSNYIIVSDSIKPDILRHHPKASITLIPNGVDIPKKQPEQKPKHILFIGRLEINQKGLDLLLSAYNKLLTDNPLPLVIAGSGERSRVVALEKLVSSLGLQKNVKLVGHVKGTLRDKLYRQSLFVVVPSRFETFCLVALEALAYSKTLVCFDIPGLNWIPTECALKSKSRNVDSLYQNMRRCLFSPSLRQKISRAGFKLANKFTWDSAAVAYDKTIRSYLN